MNDNIRNLLSDIIIFFILFLISISFITLDIFNLFNPRVYFVDITYSLISSVDLIKRLRDIETERYEEEEMNLRNCEKIYYEKSITKQIEELKGITKLRFIIPDKIVIARVIEHFYYPDGAITLHLNVGEDSFIDKGCPVISSDGLIGVTDEVSHRSSYVKPLLFSNIRVSVIIPDKSLKGVMKMDREVSELYLDYITRESPVDIGDLVFTSGDGGIFPRGILVGRVSHIEYKGGEMFKRCYISPSVDFGEVEYVGVVLNTPDEFNR